jgi:hypothetical protein
MTPIPFWRSGDKMNYRVEQTATVQAAGKPETKFGSRGQLSVEVISIDDNAVRLKWRRSNNNANWELHQSRWFTRTDDPPRRMLIELFRQGLPLTVRVDNRTGEVEVENRDEVISRVRREMMQVDERVDPGSSLSSGVWSGADIQRKGISNITRVGAQYVDRIGKRLLDEGIDNVHQFMSVYYREFGIKPAESTRMVRNPLYGARVPQRAARTKPQSAQLALFGFSTSMEATRKVGEASSGRRLHAWLPMRTTDRRPPGSPHDAGHQSHFELAASGWPQRVSVSRTAITRGEKPTGNSCAASICANSRLPACRQRTGFRARDHLPLRLTMQDGVPSKRCV